MNFKRKSFSVKLNNKIDITKNGTIYKFKKFNLISLSMDHNYYRNKVAFDLMSHINFFNLFYTYTEVIVNDKTQGIYLMLQKPKNYAFKKEKTNVMLRRDYQHEIKKTYYAGDDTTMKSKCEKAFLSIYYEIIQKEDQSYFEELSEVLDVEQYFTWMAFNYLIGNRDYTDEVFFYNKAGGDSIKFGIIPWDYDDIFMESPHEGAFFRYLNFGDKLAFSSEDALDYKLISNEFTYTKYLKTLKDVIEEISESVLKDVFELTYQELYPYYCREDIMKMSKVDKYGKTNLNSLELDMQNTYKWLVQKREATAKVLAPITTGITLSSVLVETSAKNTTATTSISTEFINSK
jgi:spore coat protein H